MNPETKQKKNTQKNVRKKSIKDDDDENSSVLETFLLEGFNVEKIDILCWLKINLINNWSNRSKMMMMDKDISSSSLWLWQWWPKYFNLSERQIKISFSLLLFVHIFDYFVFLRVKKFNNHHDHHYYFFWFKSTIFAALKQWWWAIIIIWKNGIPSNNQIHKVSFSFHFIFFKTKLNWKIQFSMR